MGTDLTKRAMLARLEPHPLAAGENDFDFICAVRRANAARLFDGLGVSHGETLFFVGGICKL